MEVRIAASLWGCAVITLLPASVLRADESTQRLAQRLAEEAAAFAKAAPTLVGEETLHQRALKAAPRFRPRVGNAAKEPHKPTWQQRTLVSEYAVSTLAAESAPGNTREFHELRQVISVDGNKIADSGRAQDALAKAVFASDDQRRLQILKDFERHGLLGAVTGVAPMLLQFTAVELPRYEFLSSRQEYQGAARILVFTYRQVDGEGISIFGLRKRNAPSDSPSRLQISGEIWVREVNYLPVRITLEASQGEGATLLRETATVNYIMSEWGALVPQTAEHREFRAGNVVAENQFEYAPFHRFGASSDIQFHVSQ